MDRKRLWKIGGLLAAVVLAAVLTNFFIPAEKAFNRSMYGNDFLPFYAAGQLVRSGQADHLYDLRETKSLEDQICRQFGLSINHEHGAFLNPPLMALPAAALANWPYPTALAIWTALLAACAIAALFLLIKMLPSPLDWRTWGLIPLLLFTAMPVWQAALHAQNTFISLLILAATVTLWRCGKPLAAGLTAGLLLFKPQLAAIPVLVLAVTAGRRAVIGLLLTGAALAILNLIALPGALSAYLHQLPANLRTIELLPNYPWQRHVTFLGWWRLLLQGHAAATPNVPARILAFACAAPLAVALAGVVWRFRKDRPRTDRLIAAALVAMPLLSPYFMDYDLTLLSIAAVLCAADALRYGVDRSIGLAWMAFYISIELNAAIGGLTPIILAVPPLAALSLLLIARAGRPFAAAETITFPQSMAVAA